MKILVINCGSSSLKYQVIDAVTEELLAKGLCERIGIDGSFTYENVKAGLGKEKCDVDIPDHNKGISLVIEAVTDPVKGVTTLEEIGAVGHRIVHGGEAFTSSVLINDEVIAAIESVSDLAPLHNPANLKGVNAVSELLPNVPQVGVFDTAFHQTMPDYAYLYAIPYELYQKYGVRRYGFHGTSHRFVSGEICKYLGIKPEGSKIITCHIGNGGSITAVKDGKSVDTTMGLTPLEGIMMGTRSGDIDAGAVTFLMEKEGLDSTGMSNLLNKKSGLLGIAGASSDMREVTASMEAGNERAALAKKMYAYRIKKYIGAFAAAMGGVDVVVFTGGVGENRHEVREAVCENMEFLGIKLDKEQNAKIMFGKDGIISTPDSKVKVVVLPTDEELMIANDTKSLVE